LVTIAFAAVLLTSLVAACGSGGDPAASEDSAQSRAAIARYRSYLDGKSADLVSATMQVGAFIGGRDIGDAQSRYAFARVLYGQIEPVSESFGALDLRIDGRAGDVRGGELMGFHRVERELWANGAAPYLTPIAEQLLADVKELQRRVKAVSLRDGQIVRSAIEVLGQVSASEIHGDEEPYAHIDLVDIAANVEGVEAAFKAVEPVVVESDPTLAANIRSRFEDAYAGLRNFGLASREPGQPRSSSPGTSFVLYTQRTQAEFHELDRKIEALSEALSQVQDEIVGS
jgi:iron uptake system component EfeO